MLAEIPDQSYQFWMYALKPELIMSIGFVVIVTAGIIGSVWYWLGRHRADVELKRDMVARGMSVEEIERVLAAKTTTLTERVLPPKTTDRSK